MISRVSDMILQHFLPFLQIDPDLSTFEPNIGNLRIDPCHHTEHEFIV